MSIARPIDFIVTHGLELRPAGLDPRDFSLLVAGFPNTRVLLLDPALPADEQEARLKAFFHKKARSPVVLAAMDPQTRSAVAINLLLEKFQLNPELLTVVDLQAALENPDPKTRTLKALDLVRLAAVRVSRAVPLGSQEIPVSRQVLVWGDSYPGLKVAGELADLGYPVILATPHASLSPLSPGAPQPRTPPEALAALLQNIYNHALIRLVTGAALLDFDGYTGNFSVRLCSPVGPLEEQVGAVVLAPELEIVAAPERYGLPLHPRVLSQTGLEEVLASPQEDAAVLDPQADRLVVAFMVGPPGESYPPALRRALSAASQLLESPNCQVYLLVGDAKVAEPGLEKFLRLNQDAGLVFVRLSQLPEVTLKEDRPQITFFDPVMRESLELAADLVVYDESYRGASGNAVLAELLRLGPAPHGFLQGDNVHNLPVATCRNGIYVVGPARAVMDLDESLAEADAAVLAVQSLLGRGVAVAPRGRAEVDRGRCALCLTCYRLCPHGAIVYDNRACIKELACQGCGVCASECPNDAIQIRNCTDDQIRAHMRTLNPQLAPRLVAFMCQNSAWEAYQAALKLKHAALPLGFTAIKMPCAGKIDVDYLVRAFTHGIAGVLVLACHPDNCKSHKGNSHARWRVEQAQALLAEAGLDPRRLLFKSLAANTPQDLLDAVEQLRACLKSPQAA